MDTEGLGVTARDQLVRMLGGYRISQMIIVAARLGVADALANGPRSVDELAVATRVNGQALYRVLRGLASVGIFRENDAGHFELTSLAETLRSEHPDSVHALAVSYGEEWWWNVWGQMFQSVRSGETAFDRIYGESLFEYLEHHQEAARRFNEHMVAITAGLSQAVVGAYDFSASRHVCDVGGGHGALLREILQRHRHIDAVLFDKAAVIAGARDKMREAGLSERCELVEGDFFAAVPRGADTYVLKSVIHDWHDEQAARILRNCRDAMSPGAKLLLVEHVIAAGNEPSIGKMRDMTMLVLFGGRERTEREYRELLRCSGFQVGRVIATDAGVSVIEAQPV